MPKLNPSLQRCCWPAEYLDHLPFLCSLVEADGWTLQAQRQACSWVQIRTHSSERKQLTFSLKINIGNDTTHKGWKSSVNIYLAGNFRECPPNSHACEHHGSFSGTSSDGSSRRDGPLVLAVLRQFSLLWISVDETVLEMWAAISIFLQWSSRCYW